ncbi:MAG: hypothetical protein ACYDAI_04065 [Trichloromonadaceae bacterium]
MNSDSFADKWVLPITGKGAHHSTVGSKSEGAGRLDHPGEWV